MLESVSSAASRQSEQQGFHQERRAKWAEFEDRVRKLEGTLPASSRLGSRLKARDKAAAKGSEATKVDAKLGASA